MRPDEDVLTFRSGGAEGQVAEGAPLARLGRYELRGELGRGGMGRVWLAWDPSIGREVAIKVLLSPSGAAPQALERFTAEARITGQLEHPHIVPVHDVGRTEDGQIYYVMRRVQGQDLSQRLQEGAAWGLQARLHAFVSVCEAVAYAHHRGVLHQDLKPQNVLLGPFGEVLVLDWGLATLTRAGLEVGLGLNSGLLGTPGFIAPERLARPEEAPGPLADQWSLGATLYALLCGRPPYPGASSRERIAATLAGPPEDPRLVGGPLELPAELCAICARAMHPEPAQRYPDVSALSVAIRTFQEGRERRQRALGLVEQADEQVPLLRASLDEARALEAEAARLLEGVKGTDPLERKLPGWALQDQATAARQRAELERLVWEQRLQGALQLSPDLREAHLRLAAHHREALEAAEAGGDPGAAARAEWLLRQHDRGHHRRYLQGTGRVWLETEPAEARVQIWRLGLEGRRLAPTVLVEERETPLVELPLAPGSYLLLLSAPGRALVRYPLHLGRAETWEGRAPGEPLPRPIYLPRLGELGPEDVYVPAGWCRLGGDLLAVDALSARRVWIDAFVCRRWPVTQGEYLDWLQGLIGRGEEVERLLPRDVQRPAHPLDGQPLLLRGPDGRLGPPPGEELERWRSLPVTRLDLHSCRRYAREQGWRLPDELEREKAARGVDGRFYPWGAHHDPALSNVAASQALPVASPVQDFPLDESIYGLRGLAGNVRDICNNRWTEEGPAGDGERLVLSEAPEDVDYISVRGGAWSGTGALGRAAVRFGDLPTTRYSARGLRLCRSLEGGQSTFR